MIFLVNYANGDYKKAQILNTKSAKIVGKFDGVYSYSPEDIDESFRKKNKEILEVKRGNGLWLWKPYFVLKTLNQINIGDILVYCDSGSFFIRNVNNVTNTMKQTDILVTDVPLLEEQFTKKICFEKMECNEEKYYKTNQIQATFFILRKTNFTLKFVKKWLDLCQNKDLIFPSGNKDEIELFIAHREDQSILSLLCKKQNISVHRDFSQRSLFPYTYQYPNCRLLIPIHKDKYKTILFLHKQKNISLFNLLYKFIGSLVVNMKRKIKAN
jgi:hypothetical protein